MTSSLTCPNMSEPPVQKSSLLVTIPYTFSNISQTIPKIKKCKYIPV